MPEPLILTVNGHAPNLHQQSWVAPNATVVGHVTAGPKASIWYGAVLRAEFEPIEIGEGSNLQDNVTVHVDPGFPATIGAGVSVGHNAVLHGCTIEDGCLIGMGAVILSGSRIGAGALVAAGALVREGAIVPAGVLIAGVPGKVLRELTEEERARVAANSLSYVEYTKRYLSGELG